MAQGWGGGNKEHRTAIEEAKILHKWLNFISPWGTIQRGIFFFYQGEDPFLFTTYPF